MGSQRVGPWGPKELDTTEQLSISTVYYKEVTYTVTQIVDVAVSSRFSNR